MSHLNQIQNLVENQQFEQAAKLWENLEDSEKNTAEAYNVMGIIQAYCGELQQARKYLELAKDMAPKDVDILFNLAFVASQQGDVNAFYEIFNQLYEMDLTDDTYLQLEEWKKALYGARETKKVLMIAYYFPPLSGSGVFRSLKFAKYLRYYGWEPTVISASSPPKGWAFSDDSQMDEIPEGLQVIRIEDEASTGKSISVSTALIEEYQMQVFQKDPELVQICQQLLQQGGQKGLIQLLQFPHHDLYWTYKVAQYIEKNIDMSQYDVIYTTSGPYSAHVLGCYLKDKYQRPWVADYRDEWTGNPYAAYNTNSVNYRMFYLLERLLLKQASKNITMAESLVGEYKRRFGLKDGSIVSITNGYDEEDFQSLQVPECKNDCFTIVYSGLIYSKERSLEPFLKAIRALINKKQISPSKLKLICVGNQEKELQSLAKKYRLEDIVKTTGYISHHQALQYTVQSDLLLLMMGDEEKYQHYYSGKIFDYIRCKRQILALAPQKGVLSELFNKMGYGMLTQSTNQSQIQRYLLQEYQKWDSATMPIEYEYGARWRFERCHLTGQLADVLDSVQSEKFEFGCEIYDSIYQTGGAGQAYYAHYTQSFYYPCWKQALRYLYMMNRDVSILEVGCGAGQFANMLFDAGFYHYKGLDYSKEAINLAKRHNPLHQELFFVADAFEDPILKEPHDLVIMFEILEHIQDDLKLLSRLPYGTKVLLSVPNFMDPTHVRCFKTEEEVRARFQSIVDIEDIQCVPIGNTTNVLFYILGKIIVGEQKSIKQEACPAPCTLLPLYNHSVLEVDKDFGRLVEIVKQATPQQLEATMVANFKKQSKEFRQFVAKVTHGYPIRGVVDAETGKGTMVSERVECLKKHMDEFEWLYNRLADYRSRCVLYGILAHWITYNPRLIKKIQEPLFADYFDLDIMPLHDQEVIVDLGMYIGDTVVAYRNVCKTHKKWYCYEVDARNIPIAQKNLRGIPNVEIRQKAVCDHDGYVYMSLHADSSSNIVGKGEVRVPAVTLDEDIKEPVTLIKMDIEGSEQAALRGSIQHIKNEKPKLAICTYHGNYDIWQIPRLIDSIRGDYKFYMRYNGTDCAIPREYVLIAI